MKLPWAIIFPFCTAYFTKIFHLGYRPTEYEQYVSFIRHPCMKLITKKLQPLPCKVPKRGMWWLCNYFISHVCLFKILETVVWIIFALFQAKPKPNLMHYYIFYKDRWMWYMTLNEELKSYSLPSWMRLSIYICWGSYFILW